MEMIKKMNLLEAPPSDSYTIVDLDAGFFTNRTLDKLGLEPQMNIEKMKAPYFEKVIRIKIGEDDTLILGEEEAEGVIIE